MRASAATTAAALVVLAAVTGCVPSTPDADTYDDKAAQTLGSAVSEVRTVQRLLQTLSENRMFRASAVTQVRYSEDALDTANKAFTELDQPVSRDRLARDVGTLLGDAGDLLTDARTAIVRRERADYPRLAEDLGALVEELEKVEGRVS